MPPTEDLTNTSKSGTPSDPCPPKVFHLFTDLISEQLKILCTEIIQSGIFPDAWKIASVRPLLKKSNLDPAELGSYRPISRLPFLSKVLEKILNKQLPTYIAENNLLDHSQFGFREGNGTETALVTVTEELRKPLDAGKKAALILLDLSAAFDTISHKILADRMKKLGFHDSAIQLMVSYFTNRTVFVDMDGTVSKSFDLPCGVPQGSSLSPTLFNIYVTPLAEIIRQHGFTAVSYANDTQIVVSISDNIAETADCFNSCMSQINRWMSNNCLKLNSQKTEVLLLGTNTSFWSPSWWPSEMGDCPEPVKKVKNLGVIFDDKLTFGNQISKLTSTFWGMLKIIKKIRPFIPADTLKTVVTALAISRLDYGNALYVGLQSQLLSNLQRMQNAAARLILNVPKFQSISYRLRDLHWLPVEKRILFKSLCLAYKALQGTGPSYLRSHLTKYRPTRDLRSTHAFLLNTPRYKQVRWGGRSFVLGTARSWNILPLQIKNCYSLSIFRKQLKTWLFNN